MVNKYLKKKPGAPSENARSGTGQTEAAELAIARAQKLTRQREGAGGGGNVLPSALAAPAKPPATSAIVLGGQVLFGFWFWG